MGGRGTKKYEARNAERLVMQVPCATLRVKSGGKIFVMEKVGQRSVYVSVLKSVQIMLQPRQGRDAK